jgi:hypothetical protein
MAIAAAAVVVPVGLLFFASGLIVNLIQVPPFFFGFIDHFNFTIIIIIN